MGCSSRVLWDVDHLRVEGEGLREPEGVRVVFVIISKLLTLNRNTEVTTIEYFHTLDSVCFCFKPRSTSLISCLSNHRSTSGPSSVSARYTASLAIKMAAAS